MNENIRIQGIFSLIDFQRCPSFLFICRITDREVKDNSEAMKYITKGINEPPFSYCSNLRLKALFPPKMIFDVQFCNVLWDDMHDSFMKYLNELDGMPSWSLLYEVLSSIGVIIQRNDSFLYGKTTIEFINRNNYIPIISINNKLNDNQALLVLVHEVGHLVLHIPILVAQALTRIHKSPYNETFNKIYNEQLSLLENDADSIGSAILMPPSIINQINTNSKFTEIIALEDGRYFNTTFEYKVFENLCNLIKGKGVENWNSTYEKIRRFNTLEWDNNNIIKSIDPFDLVENLLCRYTNKIITFKEKKCLIEPFQVFFNLNDCCFHIITNYLSIYFEDEYND